MAGELTLRRAMPDDSGLFLALRNDPVAVAMSSSRRAVSAVEHAAWFAWALQAAPMRLYVVERDGAAIGTGRLTLGPDGAELSIAVAPAWRGMGVGRWLVGALVAEARALGATPWADVRPENVASLRAFLANGFASEGGPIRLVRR